MRKKNHSTIPSVAELLAVFLTLCAVTDADAAKPGPVVVYVAVGGNDTWSGTVAEPNADKADGPFATLERARDRIREMKRLGGLPKGGVTVELRPGIYERRKPFELTAEDSGTEAAPVVYRASPAAEVRILGGRTVAGFQPVKDPAVLKRLDQAARDKVLEADLKALGITEYGEVKGGGLELFFQDKPMTLARWPNQGFVHVTDLVGGEPVNIRGKKGDKIGKFMYEGDRPKRWADENDVWVHGYWFWDWSDQRHKVESIDTEQRIISVAPPYHGYGYRKGQWFYALNLLAEIDAPGEWYLDRESGVLYFWPPTPVEKSPAIVSVLDTLVIMRDASHVTLHGMTLEAARGTAVTIDGGEHNRVVECTLRNLGGWAVRISGGKDHGVVGCHVHQIASGGIWLLGGDRKTLTPAGHHAVNNHIHDCGRWNPINAAGVALRGVGHRVANNLIHHLPHQAVFFSGNDHVIELNEIHHVCQQSNDAGAIYSGRDWTMRGTVIRHNFMHHINGFKNRGCKVVYLDDMFSGTEIVGNVFYKVKKATFVGGGRDCRIENNIFVDCDPAVHIDSRAKGWARYHVNGTLKQRLDAMPIDTPPWSERYPKLVTLWNDDPAAPKGNVVARNICWRGRWDEFHGQASKHMKLQDNLVGVDPRFVDPASANFQLRDDSPVYSKVPGFKRIPFERIGLKKD